MPVILSISTLQWLGVFITFMFINERDLSFSQTVLVLCTTYMCIKFGTLALVVALKWLVLGRTKPGRYPLWGSYFYRWWFVQRLNALVHPSYLANSPIMRLYLRLMGARIGSGVLIAMPSSVRRISSPSAPVPRLATRPTSPMRKSSLVNW